MGPLADTLLTCLMREYYQLRLVNDYGGDTLIFSPYVSRYFTFKKVGKLDIRSVEGKTGTPFDDLAVLSRPTGKTFNCLSTSNRITLLYIII